MAATMASMACLLCVFQAQVWGPVRVFHPEASGLGAMWLTSIPFTSQCLPGGTRLGHKCWYFRWTWYFSQQTPELVQPKRVQVGQGPCSCKQNSRSNHMNKRRISLTVTTWRFQALRERGKREQETGDRRREDRISAEMY